MTGRNEAARTAVRDAAHDALERFTDDLALAHDRRGIPLADLTVEIKRQLPFGIEVDEAWDDLLTGYGVTP